MKQETTTRTAFGGCGRWWPPMLSWPRRSKNVHRPSLRPAALTVEALVAFSLLTTAITVSLPLVVRHQRLLETARHYRLALDELSNQIDRLSTMSATDLPAELIHLAPSDFAAQNLPHPVLTSELQPADIGQRLTLRMAWSDAPQQTSHVALAAWLLPVPSAVPAPPKESP
jgi:hypothetical protein